MANKDKPKQPPPKEDPTPINWELLKPRDAPVDWNNLRQEHKVPPSEKD